MFHVKVVLQVLQPNVDVKVSDSVQAHDSEGDSDEDSLLRKAPRKRQGEK